MELKPDNFVMRFKKYLDNVFGQVDTDGIGVDETFNTLTGGKKGITVSMRAAYGAGYRENGRTGPRKFGWCVFCRFLSFVVQKNHCAYQFTPGPSSWSTWIRAGFAFTWGVYSIFHWWGWVIDAAIFAAFAIIEFISRK